MVFVLAWTIGDASSLSSQSSPQFWFPASTIPTTVVRGFFGRFCMYGVILKTEWMWRLFILQPEPPLLYGFWEVALMATVCLSWQITLVVWSSGNN